MKNLLILESPNKVKKVQGYVGSDYLVSASKGHIRTLGTQKVLGIDIEKNFQPKYNIDPNKRNVVKMLKELSNKCDDVLYIATDFDREGEAIGWHVVQVLDVKPKNIKRLVFKEITKKGLQDALKNPVALDMNMVNSQQARMILDKLIGYKVSPVLWKQFNNYKLSAGRVQSVVVKLINERETEIHNFKSSNYFKLTAAFSLDENDRHSDLDTECETKLEDINEVQNIINNTNSGLAKYYISDLKTSKTKRKPSPPFTTSSLQQEASNKLGMSPDTCMKAAQKLYEQGLITYMRTDSLMLSDDAMKSLETTIKSKYGDKYYKQTRYNKKSKGAQEAHEACRPTDLNKEMVLGIKDITARENRLYQLIWRRTMACQMSPADVEIKTTKVSLNSKKCNPKLNESKFNKGKEYVFTGKFEKILFDGYLTVYNYKNTDNTDNDDNDSNDNNEDGNNDSNDVKSSKSNLKKMEKLFAKLKKDQELWPMGLEGIEKQTKCPQARYTEASLIKRLEDLGIGRPSTYASMVTKVQTRGYVEKLTIQPVKKEFVQIMFKYPNIIENNKIMQNVDGEKNKLFPTRIGIMITNLLNKDFEKFMDYGFTALVEEQLDEIANGKIKWTDVVNNVWLYLYPIIDKLASAINKNKSETGTNAIKRLIGVNPNTDNNIYVMSTRYGWTLMEEVSTTNKKSNKWAPLPTNMKPDNLTLEDCLSLLVWPKLVGEYKGMNMELCKSRNVYLKYNDNNYSIENYFKYLANENNSLPKNKQHVIPIIKDLTVDDCINIINYTDNIEKISKEQIKFDECKDIIIRNGPYGYYIRYL